MLHALWLPEITIRQEQAANQRCLPHLNARLMRPYVHPLNVADFKGILAG